MSLARPLVSVIQTSFKASGEPKLKGKKTMVKMPDVFKTPLRDDLVKFVFHQLARNKRQAHGVSRKAGVQCSAESWGTGRAIARVPRVRGSGTHRACQGAYANMCRGGHMFSPRVTWRRWHRKVNLRQKRYAMAVAVAATALPSLVMARGHRVGRVREFPVVFGYDKTSLQSLSKTKNALLLLKKLGAEKDLTRCRESQKIRPGKGKMRNRRYVMRKGPLLIHSFSSDHPFVRSFRNIPGIELANVKRLNLLKLAPGAKLGRFVIWTKTAFKYLQSIFHKYSSVRTLKHGEIRPHRMMTMPDIGKIINSDAVQKVLNRAKPKPRKARKRINPLKNAHKMHELNPFAREARRRAILRQKKVKVVRTQQKLKKMSILNARRSAIGRARAKVAKKLAVRRLAKTAKKEGEKTEDKKVTPVRKTTKCKRIQLLSRVKKPSKVIPLKIYRKMKKTIANSQRKDHFRLRHQKKKPSKTVKKTGSQKKSATPVTDGSK